MAIDDARLPQGDGLLGFQETLVGGPVDVALKPDLFSSAGAAAICWA